MKRASLILAALLCASPQPVLSGESGRFLPRVVAESEMHRESLSALVKGRRDIPIWVRSMISRDTYVALASEAIEVDGKPMELFRACEPRNCPVSEIRVLFSPDGKRAVMMSRDVDRGVTLLGDPSPAERVRLED
ncbi:hypothetical protein J5J10_13290 [Ciceribacter sp. L1K23]|uniref:Ivy family c-type lysozyme inhibitor n=1 Tax=Ciceribacter sp. L1K23 TaxID=2820276 RepID=UPI001B8326A3|nr:Ivy family c-type lysozyme inhibitor [Ciceribacter sp. L1K23]MBR0556654.1 hypothetical protein [Ciceribacter sp. L1K23]